MKQLSKMDATFVYQERPSTPMHISPILLYNNRTASGGIVRFKDVMKRFADRIHLSPVFRRKLLRVPFDLDNPYWIEDRDFDLEFHVRHLALPKPGDWRQFCIQIARLHSRPLDLSRPPWEAYVIEGLDNVNGLEPGSFALYMKIHHSAIDGATGNQIVEALHDLTPQATRVKTRDNWQWEDEPRAVELLFSALRRVVLSPSGAVALTRLALNARSREKQGFEGNPFTSHELKVKTRFNSVVTPHRVFGGLRMPLEDLKLIKNSVGDCTINDVVLCIVGGAMREYLSAKKDLPRESLVVAVPISTRSSEPGSSESGNEVAAMLMFLRSDISDPVARLRAIHADAISSKAYANAIGVEGITTLVNSIPSGLASLGLRAATAVGLATRAPVAHTVVTNVPGPSFPLYLCGAQATLWLGAGCPVDGMSLFHTVNSYHGYVVITFLCCRELLPDPDFYHQCINRSYRALLEGARALSAGLGSSGNGKLGQRKRVSRNRKDRKADLQTPSTRKAIRRVPARRSV